MNLEIVTAYDDAYKTISDITYKTVHKYGRKHAIQTTRHHLPSLGYPPHWHKIKIIRLALDSKRDWVMWMDADAHINNQEYDIKKLINNQSDLTISEDFNGINSGVMIWRNTLKTREFLKAVWEEKDQTKHEFEEQHAITKLLQKGADITVNKVPQRILNAYDYNLYGTQHHGHYDRQSFAIHFPGITYPYTIRRTCEVLNENTNLNLVNKEHLEWLYQSGDSWHKFDILDDIVKASGEKLEGDCLHEHLNIDKKPTELIPKQLNLISAAIKATEAMEIGFNAGHSALFMLLANPQLHLKCFDNLSHKYTLKCYQYLKYHFRTRIEMIAGDSNQTVTEYHKTAPSKTYDLIHIDGSHEEKTAQSDLTNSYQLLESFGTLIWDDVHCPRLNDLIEQNAKMGRLKEYTVHQTTMYPHRLYFKPIGIPPEGHNCTGHPMRIFAKS